MLYVSERHKHCYIHYYIIVSHKMCILQTKQPQHYELLSHHKPYPTSITKWTDTF